MANFPDSYLVTALAYSEMAHNASDAGLDADAREWARRAASFAFIAHPELRVDTGFFARIERPTDAEIVSNTIPFVRFEYAVNGVNCIRRPMYHHSHNLSYTASGYGNKLPTQYMVRVFSQRWHRVYCICYSNVGTCYVIIKGKRYIVDIN